MLLVGVTGGIGSGKSTVARMLKDLGAIVLDADELARRAVDPGTPGHAAVVEAFGPDALGPDGDIDRHRLADRVFADPDARQLLESIVHPEVARLFSESIEPLRSSDRVVVYVVPLLVENELQAGFDVVVVVSATREARVARLASDRGMSEAEVDARARAQGSDEERERAADVVIRNDGAMADLARDVGDLWERLRARAATTPKG